MSEVTSNADPWHHVLFLPVYLLKQSYLDQFHFFTLTLIAGSAQRMK